MDLSLFNRLGRILSHSSPAKTIAISNRVYLTRGSEVGLNDIHVDSWVEGYTPTALAVMFLHFLHCKLLWVQCEVSCFRLKYQYRLSLAPRPMRWSSIALPRTSQMMWSMVGVHLPWVCVRFELGAGDATILTPTWAFEPPQMAEKRPGLL